jgi:hypothetical protein
MSNPASTLAPDPVAAPRLSNERSKEELELAERLIEHSQGIQHGPPITDRRTTPSTADGGDVERLSDDGGSETSLSAQQQQLTPQHSSHQQQQNLQLPSIHELTWVKQRKPFNTGMGGAGQVCRYLYSCIICSSRANQVSAIAVRREHHYGDVLQLATRYATLAVSISRHEIRCDPST